MSDPDKRLHRVSTRTDAYVHLARRKVLELFGPEAARDHTIVTLQLATAMIALESAEIIADALSTKEA